jgi:Stress responsive A/B Barrel Domain
MSKAIQHMVIFNLKHGKDSIDARTFLKDGRHMLSKIPGVENFEVFSQVSQKNDYDYGFSMIFKDQSVYDAYNNHPLHVDFVENRWKKEVTKFLEIDLVKE